ncbi:MAG: hypothetical protein GXX82_11740 [Syntrophorhabdus sp.]|nr:hypothetical protein [Syntrophorhabdus sp.]
MKASTKSIICLAAGLVLMVGGIVLSSPPGTIPFLTILLVTVAFLCIGKAVGLAFLARSRAREDVVSSTLKQYYAIVVLTAFSFQSLCGYFFLDGFPFHDNVSFYSLFHDNLQSLNYFGTPAWWFPHNQFGFPGYFYSILGNVNCLSPVFITLAAVFWALGRLGIYVTNIMPVYIWYFGAIVPFVFSLSVWFFARRILTSTTAILFVAIVTAFSPGVLLNLGDLGLLEAAAYGLLLGASYIQFVEKPGNRSFLIFVLMLLVFAVTINYALIIWNLLFLSALFFVMMVPRGSRTRISETFKSVSKWKWAVVAVLVIVCLSPPFLTLLQKGDIVRTTTYAEKDNRYLHMEGSPGNPLEALMSSTPGVGFFGRNTGKGPYVNYPVVVGSGYMGYIYLGLMTIPLLIIGLLHGRSDWRLRILILLILFFGVVMVANYSPLFLMVLNLNTPLTKNSHFNDVLYRSGGFVLLVLGAGMGLEALLKGTDLYRKTLLTLIASVAVSFLIYLLLSKDNPVILGFLMGFWALMTFCSVIVLLWLRRGQDDVYRNAITGMFLVLVLCDVSTMAHMHVRQVMNPHFPRMGAASRFDAQNPDRIGVSFRVANGQADTTLSLSSLMDLQQKGITLDKLPRYALFGNAHVSKDVSKTDFEKATRGSSLALEREVPEMASVSDRRLDPGPERAAVFADGKVEENRTYSSVNLNVSTDGTALLFIRDGYHPYWKATVNGKDAMIFRALKNFKAVVVPAGVSVVRLTFRPPGIAPATALAYLCIVLVFLLLAREMLSREDMTTAAGGV